MPYLIQPMQMDDVEEVGRIEKECFSTPWPVNAYRRELRENRLSRYVVVRWENGGRSSAPPPEPEQHRADGDATDALAGMRRAVAQLLKPFGLVDRGQPSVDSGILGFAGMWLMFDEAHVTTIGVRQSMRGRGLGELLLVRLIEHAQELGAKRLTLEVRVSNVVAQSLYRKYTFKEEGVRKRYYSDDGEDALIMWSDHIDDQRFQRQFAELKARLLDRLKDAPPPGHTASS